MPLLEGKIEQALRLMGIGRIEDAAYLPGNRRALIEPTDVALRVVLQVKLAPAATALQETSPCGPL